MSNVLFGLIGVIIFIGLAIAGAVVLGAEFTRSSAATKATRYISELDQIAQAANMYELKTGRRLPATSHTALLSPRFLSGDFDHSKPYYVRRIDSVTAYVYRLIPHSEADACAEMQRIYGYGKTDGDVDYGTRWNMAQLQKKQVGCLQYGAGESFIIFKSI